jgi:sulfate permease, SulP family
VDDSLSPSAPVSQETPVSRWGGMLQARFWLRGYQSGWLQPDILAGVTLAAYILPSSLGDSSLAGLPPEAGLYACMFSGLVFWIFCSSRHTTITVTSAISLLVGSSLGTMASGNPERYAALAACLALLVAALAFLAWVARAGAIVVFISETVMTGFKSGVAVYLASTQLPKLCGFAGPHGNFWERMHHFFLHAGETNLPSLALGGAALAVLLLGQRFLPNKPVSLFILVGGIAAASVVDLGGLGVKLLGTVPQGLPMPGLPAIQLADLSELLHIAGACFLLAAVETVAIGRTFAEAHGYRVDTNQEFLALAGANLAAGLGRGYPVSGGMSQSLVNESGGARTPLSGLIASGIIALVALFFSGTLRNLPQPVLAAIVIFAVTSLFKLAELKRLWHYHKGEFAVAIAALLGVLGAGLLDGVLIGAVISLLLLLGHASQPHIAFLGRIPGTQRFSDVERHPDNEPTPGVLAFRVESSILYMNTEYILDTVVDRVKAAPAGLRLVVADLSTSPLVDLAGAHMLAGLHAELAKHGIAFSVVEARASVRDMLRGEGVEEKVGPIDRRISLADVIAGG